VKIIAVSGDQTVKFGYSQCARPAIGPKCFLMLPASVCIYRQSLVAVKRYTHSHRKKEEEEEFIYHK